MLTHLRNTFDKDSKWRYHDEFERIQTAPMLVIDDLSAERLTEWAQEQMYQIVNHRHIDRLPTVITTNENVLQMVGRIGSRIRDWHTARVLRLDVQDNRLMLPRRMT